MPEIKVFDVEDPVSDTLEKDPGFGGYIGRESNIDSMSYVLFDVRLVEYSLPGYAFDHSPDVPRLDRRSGDLFFREGLCIVDAVGRSRDLPALEANKPIEVADTELPTLAFYLNASRHN